MPGHSDFKIQTTVPTRHVISRTDDCANAMLEVYSEYKNNHDVAAAFAEPMMTRTAWKLSDVRTGLPAAGSNVLGTLGVIMLDGKRDVVTPFNRAGFHPSVRDLDAPLPFGPLGIRHPRWPRFRCASCLWEAALWSKAQPRVPGSDPHPAFFC